MSAHEFDAHADSYRQTLDDALAIGGGDSLYYAERKFAALRDFMVKHSRVAPLATLDFGCGTGTNLPFLRELFSNTALYGVDVSSRSLELASQRNISDCKLTSYDGKNLPFEDAKFDLVVVSNVLHHIEPRHRLEMLKEITRCMKPDGLLVVFEHNPANPVTRKVVRDCPFDAGVTLVRQRDIQPVLRDLGYRIPSLWNIIFVPAALKRMNAMERSLRWLPLGAQYALFAEWKV